MSLFTKQINSNMNTQTIEAVTFDKEVRDCHANILRVQSRLCCKSIRELKNICKQEQFNRHKFGGNDRWLDFFPRFAELPKRKWNYGYLRQSELLCLLLVWFKDKYYTADGKLKIVRATQELNQITSQVIEVQPVRNQFELATTGNLSQEKTIANIPGEVLEQSDWWITKLISSRVVICYSSSDFARDNYTVRVGFSDVNQAHTFAQYLEAKKLCSKCEVTNPKRTKPSQSTGMWQRHTTIDVKVWGMDLNCLSQIVERDNEQIRNSNVTIQQETIHKSWLCLGNWKLILINTAWKSHYLAELANATNQLDWMIAQAKALSQSLPQVLISH